MKAVQTTGVIIMTYGSATTADNVAAYMQHIYGDKIADGLIEDFEERYRLVGRSPLIEITQQQAEKVQALLDTQYEGQRRYIVRSGMLHSEPFIEQSVIACKEAGATHIVGVILSPQFSSFIMQGYHSALQAAASKHGYSAEQVTVAEPWPTEPHFIELLSHRVNDKLAKLHPKYGKNIPVVFTTHSLPERVVAKDPTYLDQLKATSHAIVDKLNDTNLEWYRAYQSAGHTPEAWLKPDLVDILAQLRDKKLPAVLIVPIQFLADHLEILYDLDMAGGEQCDDYGISYNRIDLPNTAPLFIEALAAVARHAEAKFKF